MTHILIVDDNTTVQRVLSHTLNKAGYEIFTADNGLEALDYFEEAKIDLAIIDIAMPEMDGITLLQHLRHDTRYQNLPIIMLTASGQDEDRMLAKSEGANDFLTKPTSSRELVETVKRLLGT